ncbi:MAG: succinyl-diaminopimelate desuccinylase, partial [Acidimicrobiia bacterium]|nr:succinyl-diaminopimelate desuccinylase [Acidimicrobiia bacterium]
MPSLTETLAWLVDIPSETGGEAELRDAIAERLTSHQTTVVADSLVVGEPSSESVILAGHLDTVPLQGSPGY